MLQNWLKPLPAAQLHDLDALPAHALGKRIAIFKKEIPDLKKTRIALIGLAEKEAAEVRRWLYRMAWPFPDGALTDLGNARKSEPAHLIPLLFELISGKILPVLIGGPDRLTSAQFLAYQESKALVNWAVVDERLRFSPAAAAGDQPDLYNPVLLPRHPLLFNFGLVGLQIHQTDPQIFDFFEKNNFDAVRLGRSRTSLEETEPILRDADLLSFHLAALKQSEAPGVEAASPSGFFAEEACQICRYAGMSDKLSSFGVYGFQADRDREGQTAQVVAQLVWYFIEGFFNRKNDFPASTDGLTEYIVDLPALQYQITFWKSTKSGRWWMQTPVASKRKHLRHRLIPCTYQDYQAAVREELPERLVMAFRRFG